MNRSLLVPAAALALLAIVAPFAQAGVPGAFTSTAPSFIRLLGATGSVPDAVAGRFTVVVRDLAQNPLK